MYYTNIVWADCCIPPNLMGDHGTMARGTHAGVQDEGRQAAGGIAFLVLSETNAVAELMKDPGAAPETLRRWRNRSEAAVVEEPKQSARDTMAELKQLRAENAELRRVNEIPATASAFSRYGYLRMHPADCAGLGFPEGRPRPGDVNHARTRHTRHQAWQDARHHQVSPGNRRQADFGGVQVRGRGSESASRGRHYLRVHSQRLVRLRGVCRHIVGWACATTMNTEELQLQALDQAISWAASHDGRTVSCTTATTGRNTPARYTPSGLGNMACFPRPAWCFCSIGS